MIRWNIKEINNKKLHNKITITQYMTKIIVILRYSLNFIDKIFPKILSIKKYLKNI